MSLRPPRTTWRTSPRDLPVSRTISFSAIPCVANARIAAFASSRRNQPECCRSSAQRNAAGSTTALPMAARGAEDGGTECCRTTRGKVSLLTGNSRRRAKLCPGRPPRARPRWCTILSRRVVRRANGRPAVAARRSVKTRRRQLARVQRNRRVESLILTARPCDGRSDSDRW